MELEGADGPDEEPSGYRPLLPPDDRVWRHPSEVTAGDAAQEPIPTTTAVSDRPAVWSVALVSGLIGAVMTFGLVAVTGGLERTAPGIRETVVREQVALPASRTTAPEGEEAIVRIAEEARPAIVRIEVSGGDITGTGSGVIFRDDGHLLTNAHVVSGADDMTVVLATGEELPATLVGADDPTDIAVLKIEGGPFPTAVLGSAANLKVGQRAVAIGSPLGLAGGPSVTTGVVSALGRRVEARTGSPLLDMIQTDAPIAPGSSGGALLDGSGAVIGITTAIAVSNVGAEGLGFATPIDIARSVAADIIRSGRARHPWIGILGSDLDAETASGLGVDGGALINRVYDESPADNAGLEEGDVIIEIQGVPVSSISELVVILRDRRPGDRVDVVYVRDGQRVETRVILAERPPDLPDEPELREPAPRRPTTTQPGPSDR